MMPSTRRTSLRLVSLLALAACGGGLKMQPLRSSTRQPSNVAVYFTVDTSDDKPVPGLTADKFTIYEDGSKVSEFESKQTILNPTVAASHYTLLLIDMSGSVVESKKVDDVVAAASNFTQRVEKYQKVGVYAFDGSPDLYPISPFTESSASATAGVNRLKTFKPRDPSTNLNGAVVEGLKELKKSRDADPKPLKFGTLVVFTDGTDRANRVSADDVQKALKSDDYKDYDIFAIGVGAEMNNSHLEDVGRNGTVKEANDQNVGKAFDEVAAKVEGKTQRYYLLSYCSPSRAGEHEVTIEAHGDGGSSGDLRYKFKADGFGPGCDPNTPPNFDIEHPPPAPKEKGEEKAESKKSLKVEKKAPPPKPASDKPASDKPSGKEQFNP